MEKRFYAGSLLLMSSKIVNTDWYLGQNTHTMSIGDLWMPVCQARDH